MQPLLTMLAQQPRLALLTDYDGTLTPIVPDPDAAQIADEPRAELHRLAKLIPTAIVSGRSRAKIDAFVGLDELWVAGSHGFDIAGPAGSEVGVRPAEEYRPALSAAGSAISVELATVAGAHVEDNDFAVSVHYRHVAEEDLPAVEAAIERALDSHKSLARFPGKMVVELRPDLEWNKGKAVEFILAQLEESGGPVFPIYLGDDVADEDAFAAVRERGGLSILVSDNVVARDQTAAAYRLRSPKHVHRFLSKLSSMLPTPVE
jgi:trehalose-phosphatase